MRRSSEQLTQISEAISSLGPSQSSNPSNLEKFEDLNNVLEGMYDEIDKLTKKKTIELATDLIVEQVNSTLGEIQELLTDDSHIAKLKKFVPAGDLPEVRDVLFVLRQACQGMERFSKKLNQEEEKIGTLLLEAKVIKIALELFQREYSNDDYHSSYEIETNEIEKLSETRVPNEWAIKESLESIFNFERLDYIEIADYFKLS